MPLMEPHIKAALKERPTKYITVFANRKCVWVRFYGPKVYGRQVSLKQKSFWVSRYASFESCYAAAKRWRNKMLRDHPRLCFIAGTAGKHLTRRFYDKLRRPNESGVVGVSLSKRRDRANPSWIATCMRTVDGVRRPHSKGFGFKEYCEEEKKAALKKAIAYRKDMEKIHYLGTVQSFVAERNSDKLLANEIKSIIEEVAHV